MALNINLADAPYSALGDGSDETAKIQAALDAIRLAGGGRLTIPPTAVNRYAVKTAGSGNDLLSSLWIGSGTTIEVLDPATEIFQLPMGTNYFPLLTNWSRKDGRDTGLADGTFEQDIAVNGGTWNPGAWDAQDARTQNKAGILNCMRFMKVNNLSLSDLIVKNYVGWGTSVNVCSNVTGSNIRYEAHQFPLGGGGDNNDGFHLVGKNTTVRLSGISGYTNDDFVALNADDTVGVTHWWVGQGDITDVVIDGLYPEQALNGLRLLSNTSRIDGVQVRNVYGSTCWEGFTLSRYTEGGLPDNPGDYGVILIENVDLDVLLASPGDPWYHHIYIDGLVEKLMLRNFSRSFGGNMPLLWNRPAARISELELTNIAITGSQSVPYQVLNEGIVGRIIINGGTGSGLSFRYADKLGAPPEYIEIRNDDGFNPVVSIGSGRAVTVEHSSGGLTLGDGATVAAQLGDGTPFIPTMGDGAAI